MSRLGFKSVVFHGDVRLGELDVITVTTHSNFQFPNNEIRIHHLSTPSERCIPLSILQTISPHSVRCKLESPFPLEQTSLIALHASCYHQLQTAVVLIGEQEIHLVAMPSKLKKFPCFWCFSAPVGLYESCLAMLNLRCLAIVFDLDETLIVANTMKSFEDRIEALRVWLARETDPMRVAGMTAEMKRYIDDRILLKQYTENDCVVDNGKIYKVQMEEVPPLSDNHEKFARPVIRLQEKNIVLTRINPEIRDTSVLVRLRPAWEELRSYLTAKGRKRFEVYVCTMAERDYALEIWRLLDPDSHLIASRQLLDRVVCVKSGCRKSLLTVFQKGTCHPRLAMVIDDRCKVWEDKDQPRVHVVPAFTPYYAPQAETANAVPVLCVARNVACSARGTFFKDFDEVLLRKISEVFYEDDVLNLPPPPDVSKVLIPEDAGSVLNGNATAPISEGMEGAEVERNLNQSDEKSASSVPSSIMGFDLRSETQQPPAVVSNISGPGSSRTALSSEKVGLLGPPFRRDGCTADQDCEARRGLLTANHSQDIRDRNSSEPPILSRLPGQVPVSLQSECGWLVEDDSSRGQTNHQPFGCIQEPNGLKPDKQRGQANLFSLSNASQVKKGKEASLVNDLQRQSLTFSNQLTDVVALQSQTSFNGRDIQNEAVKPNFLPSSLSIGVLQEIGRRCSSKVEFKSIVSTSEDLQFSVEVLFTGEKIGVGMGRTRKDAQQQAADNALRSLAEKYVTYMAPYGETLQKGFDRSSRGNENGFLWDVDAGPSELQIVDGLPKENSSEVSDVGIGVPSNAFMPAQKRASPLLQQSAPWKKLKEEAL